MARESITLRGPCHIRGGYAVVRHVLYMAADSGTKHNPVLIHGALSRAPSSSKAR